MEKLKTLIEKKEKLKSWIMAAIILIIASFICCITMFVIFKHVFCLLFLIPVIIAFIPFVICDYIESKITKELKNVFSSRLKSALNNDYAYDYILITLETVDVREYLFTIECNSCHSCELSVLAKELITNMENDLHYNFKFYASVLQHL